jgi:hypothetical protein
LAILLSTGTKIAKKDKSSHGDVDESSFTEFSMTHKIGIFFGTDSGTTRLIAKKIAQNLKSRIGENEVAKPVNVNRIEEMV